MVLGSVGAWLGAHRGYDWFPNSEFGDSATWVQGVATLGLLAWTVHQQTEQNESIKKQLDLQATALRLEIKRTRNPAIDEVKTQVRMLKDWVESVASADPPIMSLGNDDLPEWRIAEMRKSALYLQSDAVVSGCITAACNAVEGLRHHLTRADAEAALKEIQGVLGHLEAYLLHPDPDTFPLETSPTGQIT